MTEINFKTPVHNHFAHLDFVNQTDLFEKYENYFEGLELIEINVEVTISSMKIKKIEFTWLEEMTVGTLTIPYNRVRSSNNLTELPDSDDFKKTLKRALEIAKDKYNEE